MLGTGPPFSSLNDSLLIIGGTSLSVESVATVGK